MNKYRATSDGQVVGTVLVNNIVDDVKTAKELLAAQGHTDVTLAYCGRDKTSGSIRLG